MAFHTHQRVKDCMHNAFAGQLDGAPECAVQLANMDPRWLKQNMHFLAVHCRTDELAARLHTLGRAQRPDHRLEDLLQLTHVGNWGRRVARREVREFGLFDGGEHFAVNVLLPGSMFWAKPFGEVNLRLGAGRAYTVV